MWPFKNSNKPKAPKVSWKISNEAWVLNLIHDTKILGKELITELSKRYKNHSFDYIETENGCKININTKTTDIEIELFVKPDFYMGWGNISIAIMYRVTPIGRKIKWEGIPLKEIQPGMGLKYKKADLKRVKGIIIKEITEQYRF